MTRELNQLGLMTCKLCAPHSKNLLGMAWGTGHRDKRCRPDLQMPLVLSWSRTYGTCWTKSDQWRHHLITNRTQRTHQQQPDAIWHPLQGPPVFIPKWGRTKSEPWWGFNRSDWPQMPDWIGIWGARRAGQSLELWPFLLSCSAVKGNSSVDPTSIHNNSQVALTTLKLRVHMRP